MLFLSANALVARDTNQFHRINILLIPPLEKLRSPFKRDFSSRNNQVTYRNGEKERESERERERKIKENSIHE